MLPAGALDLCWARREDADEEADNEMDRWLQLMFVVCVRSAQLATRYLLVTRWSHHTLGWSHSRAGRTPCECRGSFPHVHEEPGPGCSDRDRSVDVICHSPRAAHWRGNSWYVLSFPPPPSPLVQFTSRSLVTFSGSGQAFTCWVQHHQGHLGPRLLLHVPCPAVGRCLL